MHISSQLLWVGLFHQIAITPRHVTYRINESIFCDLVRSHCQALEVNLEDGHIPEYDASNHIQPNDKSIKK